MNSGRVLKKIQTFLFSLIAVLIIIIAAGSVFAFLRKPEKTNREKSEEEISIVIREGMVLYGDLGRLRAVSSDEIPVTVVVYPFLEYDSADIFFQEELVSKKSFLRNTFINWFGQKKAYTLLSMNESDIKKELLDAINKEFKLGKIKTVYFKEFKILN